MSEKTLSRKILRVKWEGGAVTQEEIIFKDGLRIYEDDTILQLQTKCAYTLGVPIPSVYLYNEMTMLTHSWRDIGMELTPHINLDVNSRDYELFVSRIGSGASNLPIFYQDGRGQIVRSSKIIYCFVWKDLETFQIADGEVLATLMARYWPQLILESGWKPGAFEGPVNRISETQMFDLCLKHDAQQRELEALPIPPIMSYITHLSVDLMARDPMPSFINLYQLYQLLTIEINEEMPYIRIVSKLGDWQKVLQRIAIDRPELVSRWMDVGSRAGSRLVIRYLIRGEKYCYIELYENGNLFVDMAWDEDLQAGEPDVNVLMMRIEKLVSNINSTYPDYHILGARREFRIILPSEAVHNIRMMNGFSYLRDGRGEMLEKLSMTELYQRLKSFSAFFWTNRKFQWVSGGEYGSPDPSGRFNLRWKRHNGWQNLEQMSQILSSPYKRVEETILSDWVDLKSKIDLWSEIFQISNDAAAYLVSKSEQKVKTKATNNVEALLNDLQHRIGIELEITHSKGKWFKLDCKGVDSFQELQHVCNIFNKLANKPNEVLEGDWSDLFGDEMGAMGGDEGGGAEMSDWDLVKGEVESIAEMEARYHQLPPFEGNQKIDRLQSIKVKGYIGGHAIDFNPLVTGVWKYAKSSQLRSQPVAMTVSRAILFRQILEARLRESPEDVGQKRLLDQMSLGKFYNLAANIEQNRRHDTSINGLYTSLVEAEEAAPDEQIVFLGCFEAYDWKIDWPITLEQAHDLLKIRRKEDIYISTNVGVCEVRSGDYRPSCYKPKIDAPRIIGAEGVATPHQTKTGVTPLIGLPKTNAYVQLGSKINLDFGKLGELPLQIADFFNDQSTHNGYVRQTISVGDQPERLLLEGLSNLLTVSYVELRSYITKWFEGEPERFHFAHQGLWSRLFSGYEEFINWISDLQNPLDEYMIWDVIVQPNVLFANEINLFIFKIDDKGGCHLVCPKGYQNIALAEVVNGGQGRSRNILPVFDIERIQNIVLFQTQMEMQIMVARHDIKNYAYPYLSLSDEAIRIRDSLVIKQKIGTLIDAIRNCSGRTNMAPTVKLLEDRIRGEGMFQKSLTPPLNLQSLLAYIEGNRNIDMSIIVLLHDDHNIIIQVVVFYQGTTLFLPIEPSVPVSKMMLVNISKYTNEDMPPLMRLIEGMWNFGNTFHNSFKPWAITHMNGYVLGVELESGLPVGCQETNLTLAEAQRQAEAEGGLVLSIWRRLGFKEMVWDYRLKPLLAADRSPGVDDRTMMVGGMLFERETYQRLRLELSGYLRAHQAKLKEILRIIHAYEHDKDRIEVYRLQIIKILGPCINQIVYWVDDVHPKGEDFLTHYKVPPIRQFCNTGGDNPHCYQNRLIVFKTNLVRPSNNEDRYLALLSDELLRSPFLRDEILQYNVKVILQERYERQDVSELPVAEDFKSAGIIKKPLNIVENAIRKLYVKKTFETESGGEFISPLNPIDHRNLAQILGPQKNCFEVFRGGTIAQWQVLAKYIGQYYFDNTISVLTLKERVASFVNNLEIEGGLPGWKLFWKWYLSFSCGNLYQSHPTPQTFEAWQQILMKRDHPLTILDLYAIVQHYNIAIIICHTSGLFETRQFTRSSINRWLMISLRSETIIEAPNKSVLANINIIGNVCSFPIRIIFERRYNHIIDRFSRENNPPKFIKSGIEQYLNIICKTKAINEESWSKPSQALIPAVIKTE